MRNLIRSKHVVRNIRIGVALAAVTLSLVAVATNWGRFHSDLGRVGVARTALSTAPLLAGLTAGMLAWRALLGGLGSSLDLRTATKIYFVGQLGKYIPGSVWPILAQMELGRDHDVPRRRSVLAMVTAIILSLATALAIAGLSIPWLPAHYRAQLWWLMLLVPVLAAMLHPRVLWAILGRIPKVRLIDAQPTPPSVQTLLRAAGWAVTGWICYGMHVAILASAFHRTSLTTLIAVSIGGYALAWCAGLIVFLLPAGAGARDLVLVGALAAMIPAAPALAVAVISRMVTTVCDLGYAGAAYLSSRSSLGVLTGHRAATRGRIDAAEPVLVGAVRRQAESRRLDR